MLAFKKASADCSASANFNLQEAKPQSHRLMLARSTSIRPSRSFNAVPENLSKQNKKPRYCETPIYITLSARRNLSKRGKASEEDEDVVTYVDSTESML